MPHPSKTTFSLLLAAMLVGPAIGPSLAEANRTTVISGRTAPPQAKHLYSSGNARAAYKKMGATDHARAQNRHHKRPTTPLYRPAKLTAQQKERNHQLARRGDIKRMLFEGHGQSKVTVSGSLPVEIGYQAKLFQKPNIKNAKISLELNEKLDMKGTFNIGNQTLNLVGQISATTHSFWARTADGSLRINGSVTEHGSFRFTKLEGAMPGASATNKQNLMHLQANKQKPGAGRYPDHEVGVPAPHVPIPR